jgi:DNA-binding MarR family transcriptional regulator
VSREINARPDTEGSESYAAGSARRYAEAFEWADEAAIQASLALNTTHAAQMAALGRLCDALGLNRTTGRHALVRILYFAPQKRLTQFEVAAEMQVTSSNVTFLVDGLEGEGLVRRAPHPSDRRTVYVKLTDEGEAFARRIVPSLARYMASMLGGFSEDEKLQFIRFLDRCRANAEAFEWE